MAYLKKYFTGQLSEIVKSLNEVQAPEGTEVSRTDIEILGSEFLGLVQFRKTSIDKHCSCKYDSIEEE